MNKKVITVFVIIIFIIFHKLIISQFAILAVEKWIRKDIQIQKFEIIYNKNKVIIDKIKVLDKKREIYNNVFSAEKIEIEFKPKSFFSKLIIIKNLKIENPQVNLYFKISDNKQEIIDDNMGVLKNLKNQQNPKIYPKKIIDINFLILNTMLDNFKIKILRSNTKKETIISLSDINFAPYGNEKGYQHYKDIFRVILTDMTMKIPDRKFKQEILRKYNKKLIN